MNKSRREQHAVRGIISYLYAIIVRYVRLGTARKDALPADTGPVPRPNGAGSGVMWYR